jgi:Arc/MetJ-type ribon-helix-helix transcriptional regulator
LLLLDAPHPPLTRFFLLIAPFWVRKVRNLSLLGLPGGKLGLVKIGRNDQTDVQRGPYQSDDEFVERAISLLHDQEAWLAEHGSEIRAKVEQGYAAAQRGELIDSDQVRPTLDERKRSWQAENRQA